jgi:hypothetical protein
MPAQNANSVWCFGTRPPGMAGNAAGSRIGSATPALIKARYGESMVCRIYNDLPVDRAANGGFGRNEISNHFHNAHNGTESDGACNAYHFPGTFYDYHWGTTLARRDQPSSWLTTDPKYLQKASGPDDADGLSRCREIFASCRDRCGSTTTGSSSPPRTCTRACSPCVTTTAVPIVGAKI